jgi:hypothetical protein
MVLFPTPLIDFLKENKKNLKKIEFRKNKSNFMRSPRTHSLTMVTRRVKGPIFKPRALASNN